MLGANVFVVEALGFLVGQLHDLPGAIGKTFVHMSSLWLSSVDCPSRLFKRQSGDDKLKQENRQSLVKSI